MGRTADPNRGTVGVRLVSSLTEGLTWWLIAAGGIGLLFPAPGQALRDHTPIILSVMIGGLGLSLHLGDLAAALRNPKLLGVALTAQLVSTPLLALVVWNGTDPTPITQGLVVQATAPTEITAPLMAHLAGASLSGAVSILGVSVLIAPFTMPLLLEGILGQTVPVATGRLFSALVLTVAVPLLAGSAAHTLAVKNRRRLTKLGTTTSAVMVILLVYAVAAGAQPSLIVNPGGILIPGLIGSAAILTVGLVIGWAAGRFFHFEADLHHALVFTTGMREFGIATAVSLSFFEPATAVLPAIYGITMMIVTSRVARRISRNQFRAAKT